MRRNLNGLIIMAFVLVFLLSGCGGNEAEVKVVTAPIATEEQGPTETAMPTPAVTNVPETPEGGTPTPSVAAAPTPTEKIAATPQPEVYVIDGAKIFRHSGEGSALVYDAADYFEKGWNCSLAHLLVEDGVLYFTEGGFPVGSDNDSDSVYRVVRKDDHGRSVLQEDNVIGYTQLVLYGSKIFFVKDGFDSQSIKWAYKNGNSTEDLDFSEYAAREGIKNYYNSATLNLEEDGKLYADILFYVDADPEIVEHTISISEDLEITRVK